MQRRHGPGPLQRVVRPWRAPVFRIGQQRAGGGADLDRRRAGPGTRRSAMDRGAARAPLAALARWAHARGAGRPTRGRRGHGRHRHPCRAPAVGARCPGHRCATRGHACHALRPRRWIRRPGHGAAPGRLGRARLSADGRDAGPLQCRTALRHEARRPVDQRRPRRDRRRGCAGRCASRRHAGRRLHGRFRRRATTVRVALVGRAASADFPAQRRQFDPAPAQCDRDVPRQPATPGSRTAARQRMESAQPCLSTPRGGPGTGSRTPNPKETSE